MNEHIFNDHVRIMNSIITSENKNCFITGDFNFNLLNISSHNETFNFFDNMMASFLLPTITLLTKINNVNNTVIDNIFTNHFHPNMLTGNLTVQISDHLPSFLIVPKKNQDHLPIKHNFYIRDIKNTTCK